jgi:peptide chain release factor subunit 1
MKKNVINSLFNEISKDSGKYVFGVKDTMQYLIDGYIETLIVSEELNYDRILYRNNNGEELIEYIKIGNNVEKDGFYEEERIPLVEWLLDNYKKFVTIMEIVTNASPEGNQFRESFGGLGGILRYAIIANFEGEDVVDFNDDIFI